MRTDTTGQYFLVDGGWASPYVFAYTTTGEEANGGKNNTIRRHVGRTHLLLPDGHSASIKGPSPYEFRNSGSPLYTGYNNLY